MATATAKRKRKKRTRKAVSAIEQTVERYIEGVLNGKVVAGELTRLAVKRHLLDLENGKQRGLWFDQAKAERAIEFFGYLKHSKGEWAGQFVTLEPWQMFIKWVVFGWMRKDGTRRFRNVYLEVARKNGKSTDAAGTGLYLAFADDEPGAEVYSTATKKDQAIIVHSEATRMVHANPEFKRLGIETYKHNICRPDRAQKYEPLGADEDTLDGYYQLNAAANVDVTVRHTGGAVVRSLETGVSHSAGTSSFSTAHRNTRRTRPTRWLMSFRVHPTSTIFCRTAFRAFGPNSRAGTWPYSSRTRRNVRRGGLCGRRDGRCDGGRDGGHDRGGGEFGDDPVVLGPALGGVVPAEADLLTADPAAGGVGGRVVAVGGDCGLGAGHREEPPEGVYG